MKTKNFTMTIYSCFMTSASTAVPCILSPLLFTAFYRTYGISYTLLGFLTVLNFGTQLLTDLFYSFFSKKLNLKLSVKLTPVLIFTGLFFYALSPVLFPSDIYIGLAIGTIIFSAGNGIAEVLTSPVVAAIPSDNSERLMSKLHSCYAWALLFVVSFASVFLWIFDDSYWQLLTILLSLLPLTASVLMFFSPIPDMQSDNSSSEKHNKAHNKTACLYIIGIFFAGASELTMSQWCSGYLETTFGINKTVGDLFGLALFGAFIGLGRTLYAKYGKNIDRLLFLGSLGSLICYVVVAVSNNPFFAIASCAFSGFCVSMLWPGSLIAVANKIPGASVGLYALMATGGDLGATLFPQAVGYITDKIIESEKFLSAFSFIGLNAEQLGMRGGMLFACIAPLCATVLFAFLLRRRGVSSSR